MFHALTVSPRLLSGPDRASLLFAVEFTADSRVAKAAWSDLEPAASAFQTWHWLDLWFEHVAPIVQARPMFVTVRDRASGRSILGFPLCVRRRFGLNVAEFPDLGVSDYNCPLFAPDLFVTDEQIEGLWATVRKSIPGVDLFYFNKVPAKLCDRPMPVASLNWLQPIEMRGWSVRLPETRQDYDETLERKDRKEQRRKRRNLEISIGTPVFVEADSAETAESTLALLKSLRAVRFTLLKRYDILADPRFAPFYKALALKWRTFVSLAKVRAGDMDVAAFFAIRHNGDYALIMHSFAEIDKLSPGIVALDCMITELIARRTRYCDFTIGDESYKLQFGVQSTVLLRGLDPVTRIGHIAALVMKTHFLAIATLVRVRAWVSEETGFLKCTWRKIFAVTKDWRDRSGS